MHVIGVQGGRDNAWWLCGQHTAETCLCRVAAVPKLLQSHAACTVAVRNPSRDAQESKSSGPRNKAGVLLICIMNS